MIDDPLSQANREERLNQVLLAYVEDAQAGRTPDRRRLIESNPDLKAELEEFFDGQDEVSRLMARAEAGSGLLTAALEFEESEDRTVTLPRRALRPWVS